MPDSPVLKLSITTVGGHVLNWSEEYCWRCVLCGMVLPQELQIKPQRYRVGFEESNSGTQIYHRWQGLLVDGRIVDWSGTGGAGGVCPAR